MISDPQSICGWLYSCFCLGGKAGEPRPKGICDPLKVENLHIVGLTQDLDRPFVHEQFVNPADIPVGQCVYVMCIHGDTQPYPIICLRLTIGGQEGNASCGGQPCGGEVRLGLDGQVDTVGLKSGYKSG